MAARRRAVSLPEVLVVIAIIAFMLALLVPGLGAVRERARRILCANHLRQWGVALQAYRHDHNDYIPTEGTYLTDVDVAGPWYNELPPYIGAPAYKEIEGVGDRIKDFPSLDVWICPSKNLTNAFKSRSGKNLFHYGMNQVLDGLGQAPDGSEDTPGFPDRGAEPIGAHRFARKPHTVFLFDIAWNSPAGTPRDVATMYQRGFRNEPVGRFHGDYANLLYLDGSVVHCTTDDLVVGRDFRHGRIRWMHPRLYWGYPRPTG